MKRIADEESPWWQNSELLSEPDTLETVRDAARLAAVARNGLLDSAEEQARSAELGGLGLGPTIVRHLVEMHGGRGARR